MSFQFTSENSELYIIFFLLFYPKFSFIKLERKFIIEHLLKYSSICRNDGPQFGQNEKEKYLIIHLKH